MIVLTGAAGFIGSNVALELNARGRTDILASDHLDSSPKWRNLKLQRFSDYADRSELLSVLVPGKVDCVVHLGARTETMDQDVGNILRWNFEFSKKLWGWCSAHSVPLVFASSAAVYGGGTHGFSEEQALSEPGQMTGYGWSKWLFDRWVLGQSAGPPHWWGFRFFNVYGQGEEHKGSMASMVYRGFLQAEREDKIQLFKSYRADCAHGQQERDFVYVRDIARLVADVVLGENMPSGIYNAGTGIPTSFNRLAELLFAAINKPLSIEYVDAPEVLRAAYQYHTCADTRALAAVHPVAWTPLESGIAAYVETLRSARIASESTLEVRGA